MKICLFWSVTIITVAGSNLFARESTLPSWGPITNGVQMSISLKNGGNEIETNQPVKLLIRYKNSSSKDTIMFYAGEPIETSPSYSFVVISPSGEEISLPPRPEGHLNPHKRHFVFFPPHEIRELEFNLSEWLPLNEIGTYKITAKQWLSHGDKQVGVIESFQVTSNPLDVSATAGK